MQPAPPVGPELYSREAIVARYEALIKTKVREMAPPRDAEDERRLEASLAATREGLEAVYDSAKERMPWLVGVELDAQVRQASEELIQAFSFMVSYYQAMAKIQESMEGLIYGPERRVAARPSGDGGEGQGTRDGTILPPGES